MAGNSSTFDVFIAYDHRDKKHAAEVADVLQSYGLSVFYDVENIALGAPLEDAVWEALAESQALVVIVPEDAPGTWLAFELGAASAWKKPVYAVAIKPTITRVPAPLQHVRILPLSRVEEIAKLIRDSQEPLSETELQHLEAAYRRAAIAVDQLAHRPADLAKLVADFNKKSGRRLSGEQVMRELLRLRKRGGLPRLRRQRAVADA